MYVAYAKGAQTGVCVGAESKAAVADVSVGKLRVVTGSGRWHADEGGAALHVPFHGMLWEQSRRLPVLSAGAYWLAPDEGGVHRHGIADTSLGFESGERSLVGVAPNGVRRVLMHCENRKDP